MKKQVAVILIFTIFLLLPNGLAYGLESTAPPSIAKAEITNSTAAALAAAMDIEPADLVQATLSNSDPRGAGLADAPFSFFPRQGNSFVVLSNGLAIMADDPDTNNEETYQGRDIDDDVSNLLEGLKNTDDFDLVQLSLVLTPPPTATSLSFDFAFYSEEFPDWIGFEFNDVFVAELAAEPFTSELFVEGAAISAPTNIAFDPNGDFLSVNAAFGFDPDDLNPDTGTTYDGTSGLLRATGCLPESLPTDNVVLILSITDVGDSFLDSAVLVDNFQWGNPQVCRPGAEQNAIELIPETATKVVGDQHTLTATVLDDQGDPVANQRIGFRVDGPNDTLRQSTTNELGVTTFSYSGANVGQDSITAWIDTNDDLVQEEDEAFDTATVLWEVQLPPKVQDGSITLIKEAEPASTEEQFNFTGDLGDFTLKTGESLNFNEVPPGTYRLIEHNFPKSWTLLSVRCNDEFVDVQDFTDPLGRGITVTIETWQPIECIFHNERSTYEEAPPETLLYLPLILK